MTITRRQILYALPLGLTAAPDAAALIPEEELIKRGEEAARYYMKIQNTDRSSRYVGGFRNDSGLHQPAVAASSFEVYGAAYCHPRSSMRHSPELLERLRLAAAHLQRSQSREGNIFNYETNFNSPADSAFAMRPAAHGGWFAQRYQRTELWAVMEPFLKTAGDGLIQGGIHTPNHRWVLCAALAELHEIRPDARIPRRINQWLAEGIDIDAEGQYTERSTIGYNVITNNALLTMADKLKRPELYDVVRRNVESVLRLMHANEELVTEFSRRQDKNQRGKMERYWYALHKLALRDGNPVYAHMAARYTPKQMGLSTVMLEPELLKPLPAGKPAPDNYVHAMPHNGLLRIRRGARSASLLHCAESRFFTLQHGEAIVDAVRFATAFFGKAQFRPRTLEREGEGYKVSQSLEAPYYQPFTPTRLINADEWDQTQPTRPRTEICRLTQSATLTETSRGFRLRIQASGTDEVPIAIEVALREGMQLSGAERLPNDSKDYMLKEGYAEIRSGDNSIRVGPGRFDHSFLRFRGSEAAMSGPSLWLSGLTPFDHTLEFELS
jgi:hypothetical protein